jgi:hypothetical protein
MAQIMMIIGSIALFVAGFVAWYTLWHRRVQPAFERVPSGAGGAPTSCAVPGEALNR